MTKKSAYLLGILLTIIIGTMLRWFLCCNPTIAATDTKKIVEETVATPAPIPEKIATNPFIIKDGDFDYTTNDNINFNVSKNQILTPVSNTVKTGILELSKHLSTHPNKSIDITGYYTSNESYNGALENLGIARATAVKNHFIKNGISSKQINAFGALNDKMKPTKNNTLIGPVSFNLQTVEDTNKATDELKKLRETILADPLKIYFNTGGSNINLTAKQKQQLANITKYIDKVDDAKCLVVGYTDSRGQLKTNMRLGQERADATKKYLIRNGILENKITAISKGPKEPIASNKTKEGRAKNRRTVITIN